MLSKQDAEHIAALVHSLRPDWDEPGVMNVLRKVRERDPKAIMLAAIRATERTDQRTPLVIAMSGDHWTGAPKTAQQPPAYTPPERVEPLPAERIREIWTTYRNQPEEEQDIA